jgi:two-component system CheB/CheR fusion protein
MERENFMVHVVDSDQAIADGLATLLGTYEIEVLSYPDADSFLKFWLPRRCRNCCLIAEADMPGLSGPALLRELRDLRVEIPVLMLLSTSSPELFELALSSEQVSVIQKPCHDSTLIDRVLSIRAAGMAAGGQSRRSGNH